MVEESGAKVTFLLEQGKSDTLGSNRLNKTIIEHFGLSSEGTISDWKAGKSIPPKHIPTLAALFHFDPAWPEWRDGSVDAFTARYRREVLGETAESDHAAAIREMIEELRAIPALGNVIGALAEFVEVAIAAADKPPDAMSDEDVLALHDLQCEIGDALEGRPRDSLSRASAAMAAFVELLARLRAACPGGAFVDLDEDMRTALQAALEQAEALLTDPATDTAAHEALRGLIRCLRHGLDKGRIALTRIDRWSKQVTARAGERFRRGSRALMIAIGLGLRRGGVWPELAVFTDGPEDWMPEMIALPTGSFLMGAPEDEKGRFDDEGPQHRVEIAEPFALAKYPVTFEEYDAFCEVTGREKPDDRGWGRGRRPAINVSWEDARDYCDWRSEQTGEAYRLPLEAEWEYACRARTTTRYWWGDDWDPARANGHGEVDKTTEVGSYDPNLWGLHDTHGNVDEWCEDLWQDDYEQPRTQQAFTASGETNRVIRGGSWTYDARDCRAAYRFGFAPDLRDGDLGFRPARGQASGAQAGGGGAAGGLRSGAGRVAEPRPERSEGPLSQAAEPPPDAAGRAPETPDDTDA